MIHQPLGGAQGQAADIEIRLFGRLNLFPCWPEASKNAPMEAARPTQTVEMSGRTCRMVSNTAIPAVTDPPGEFTYRVISFLGSVASSQRSCATIKLQLSSSTAPPRRMMR